MIRLYLVRHGETTFNAEGRIQGQKDPPLTPLGIRQAESVADRLAVERIDAVYSSDLVRASVTAEIVAAKHGLPVSTSLLLREANLGVVQGLTRAEIEEKFPADKHPWHASFVTGRPPGAESIQQVIDRCGVFLKELLAETSDGMNVVIVGHNGSLRGLVISALGLPGEIYQKLRFSNAGLSILELGGRHELRLLNDTCHLDSLGGAEDADSVP